MISAAKSAAHRGMVASLQQVLKLGMFLDSFHGNTHHVLFDNNGSSLAAYL